MWFECESQSFYICDRSNFVHHHHMESSSFVGSVVKQWHLEILEWFGFHHIIPTPCHGQRQLSLGRYFKTVCKSSISLCLIMSSEIHHIHFSQSKTEKYTAYCMQILSYIIYPIYHEAYLKLRYSFLHALINPRSACTNSCTVNPFCY